MRCITLGAQDEQTVSAAFHTEDSEAILQQKYEKEKEKPVNNSAINTKVANEDE